MKKEVIFNSAEFDECYFPGTSTNPVNWPLSFQPPVERVGDGDPMGFVPLFPAQFPSSAPATPAPASPLLPKEEPMTPPKVVSPSPLRPQTPPGPVTPPPIGGTKCHFSPDSDTSPPSHKVQIDSPPKPPPKPKPKAPEFKAQPISDFTPGCTGCGSGCFKTIRSIRTSGVRSPSSAAPPLQPAALIHPTAQTLPEEDAEMHDETPDLLNNWGSNAVQLCDALITDVLTDFAEEHQEDNSLFGLQVAVEYAFNACSSLPSEPSQWRDIKERPDADLWCAAALEEFNALLENGTFEPMHLPPSRNTISCRWVFKLKCKPDGSIDKYKARLVAKGFSQHPSLDYGQMFAPIVCWAALHAIFALAAIEDLEL